MENNVPEDIIKAIIAAGGNSRAARSARARKQLRDRYGRWIEMGGGLNFKFRMPNGDIVSVVGRSVGGSDNSEDGVQVYVPASDRPDIREGFYTVPASSSETAQALLSEEQLKRAGIDAESKDGSLDAGVVDFSDATFSEAPEGWTKNEDGSFTTIEDNITITPNEDGTFSLSQDGEDKGSFNNIGDAIVKSNDIDAESTLPEADKKKVAELRSQGDEDAANRVIRNEPIAMLSEEKAAEVTTPGFDYKEGDAFDLKDLAKVPAGGRIDYKHTIKSADGNDRLIENSYQKNEDGSWTKLDDNSNATVQLRNEANAEDQTPGDYTYMGVAKPEKIADLRDTVDPTQANPVPGIAPGSEKFPDFKRVDELPTPTEGLINEDVANMSPEELKAARQDALDKIAAERALPEDDQDPDLLDSLGERITDITIRENEIAGLTPTLSPADNIAGWLEANKAPTTPRAQTFDDRVRELMADAQLGDSLVYESPVDPEENDGQETVEYTYTLTPSSVEGFPPSWIKAEDGFDVRQGDFESVEDVVADLNSIISDEFDGPDAMSVLGYNRLPEEASAAPAAETDAERVARIFNDHEAIPASEFEVGDDSNSAFLKEAPVGSEVSYRVDIEDSEGTREATIKYTKTGADEWTASGDDSVEGETWSAEELSTERDTYTIDKIGEEEQVAELPAQEEAPTAEAAPAPAAETLPSAAPRSNVYGDTNDLPTLQRRLAQAEMRLERMGDDIHGRYSDEDMAIVDQQIESLNERIDAINAGEEPAIDAPIENLPEIRSVAADTTNPNTYAADVTKLENAETASEQTKVATELAVKADKNNDAELANKAAEVVAATEVFEEAETVETTPELKKNLTTFAKKLIDRLTEMRVQLQEQQRAAKTRKNLRNIEETNRRIAAIESTLDFMDGKTSQQEDYDPRATRDYVLANTTLFEDTIVRAENGRIVSAEGVYVAPTGVVYNMNWDQSGGVTATLASTIVDPRLGGTLSAGSVAGTLRIHRTDDPDWGPIITERNGMPELDASTEYIIPAMIQATGGTNTPYKTIGAGMHGFAAAIATLEGSRYQHSNYLLPPGRVASHRFHTSQPVFHSRSQREKMFDLLGAPTSKMMRKLGYHKRTRTATVANAGFDRDPDGKLSARSADATLWWGEFDRHVDTNLAKFAVIMFNRHRNNPDAVPGVDYPKFLQEYIKGGDHTKIEQLSLADVLYTLNYDGGDRSAVAAKFRTVLDELKEWSDRTGESPSVREANVPNIGGHWEQERNVRADLAPLFTVLGDVTEYLENPANKLGKTLPAAESADTVLRTGTSDVDISSIEELPTLRVPSSALDISLVFDPSRVDAPGVREANSNFTEQQIKDAIEEGITSSRRVATVNGDNGEMGTYTVATLVAALNERGVDDYNFVAQVYDKIAGNTTNQDRLNTYYENNKGMLPEGDSSAPRPSYIFAPLQRNEAVEGLKYAMDPAPYAPVGTEVEGTSDNPEDIASSFSLGALRTAFKDALKSGDAQVRLQFPGQNGEDGPEANVPVEAVRDAIQLRGGDTNSIAAAVADESDIEVVVVPNVADGLPATPASIGSTPTPDTSVSVPSTDSQADLTANPSTGTVTAADVDLDTTDGVDAYDPEVIMQVIRNQYPNAVEMANGDLIVDSHETTDADGNRIEYQTVVVRTRQEFFYTYIRRINHAETDPTKKYQSLRYGRMSQSARALNNTIKDAKGRTRTVSERHGSNTMNRWWGEPGQRGRVQQENVNPDTNEPEHVREQPIDRETVQRIVAATSDEAVSEQMVLGIFRHITQHGASQTVLNRLRSTFGMTRESMNTIVDAVNEHVAKQDRIRRFDTWVSADGETPLFEGDTVRHADGRVGVVVRRIIEHRTHEYGYSDYLYVRFPGRRSDTNMTSRNLTLVSTTGGTDGSERRGPGAIQLPDPTLTTRAQNRMRREGRINDFAPEQLQTDRFSGPLPTVEINGTKYPVSGSRQTVIGDNMDTVSGDLSTAQVGDFTTTLDPETGTLRVREIVGIEQNSDGTTTIYTFTPSDFGSGIAEGTTYSPDENGNFGRSVPLYRERPAEESGAATQREREALGTAVSEADPASVPAELKVRVEDMMSPDSAATPREVNDTAVEVSQLPKQEAGAPDSISLPEANNLLADVQAEAPGDSIINLDNIETAAGLQGATPEEKMADAPAWFKNPMTPEAVEEKMGPATPAAPVEMPAPTTPFEELPEEAPTPEAEAPRDVEVIRGEIVDVEGQLVRARSARDAMGDDPIVTGAIDNRIDELEARFSELEAELSAVTPSAPQSGDAVDGEFINGSPVGTEITTVVNGQTVTFKKNADGTWVTVDIVTLPEMDLKFTPAPLSSEQMAERANTGNVAIG